MSDGQIPPQGTLPAQVAVVSLSRSLKNLVLKRCALKGFREITSPSLNNLFINGGYDARDCLFVITAPAVTSMFLGVSPYNFTGGLSLSEMPSLAKATVDLWDNKNNIVDRFKTLGGGVSDVITNLEVSYFKTMKQVCLCLLYLPFGDVFSFH